MSWVNSVKPVGAVLCLGGEHTCHESAISLLLSVYWLSLLRPPSSSSPCDGTFPSSSVRSRSQAAEQSGT
ncbi:unnamed protein product [Gadus morhua 'NCC']